MCDREIDFIQETDLILDDCFNNEILTVGTFFFILKFHSVFLQYLFLKSLLVIFIYSYENYHAFFHTHRGAYYKVP